MKYLEYKKKEVVSHFLGTVVWVSLGTFMLVSQADIGENNIPILQLIVWTAGLVGVQLAYKTNWNYKYMVLVEICAETIFLITLLTSLLTDKSLATAGLIVYGIMIANRLTSVITDESSRHYEDTVLTNKHEKRYLKKLRGFSKKTVLLGGLIGSSVSVFSLSMLNFDLTQFTIIMLLLNVIQNIYDWYIWRIL